MKKEDFYNTNKDMNNLTTMMIDLLLKIDDINKLKG